MRLLGYNISITKAAPPAGLSPILSGGGGWRSSWFGIVGESFPGAWQRNIEVRLENVLTFSALYSCVTLIAADIGKLGFRYVEKDANGIWAEAENPAFSPVLRKPNRYQIRQKFIEQWITSKLVHGNAYILLRRDNRGVIVEMYVIDPLLTKPYIAPNGDIYYQLNTSQLAGVKEESILVPAREIIHDVMVPLYHPLCGVSPITACGLAALQGIRINENNVRFFENGARPGGILTAPALIDPDTARRLKEHWDNNYTGANAGKIAVLGDGLEYKQIGMTAVDAEVINQSKMSAEQVCTAFHVPPYMVGVGPPPNYNNIEALNQQYYSQCLQALMESVEALVDNALGLNTANQDAGTEFNLDDLLKMDTATQYKTYGDGVKGGVLAPNEARKKLGFKPVDGGDSVYMQQQQFSLEALAKRDAKPDPFATAPKPVQAPPPPKAVDTTKPAPQITDQRTPEQKAKDNLASLMAGAEQLHAANV